MARPTKPAPVDPARILESARVTAWDASTPDGKLVGEIAVSAMEAVYKARSTFGRMDRGMARLIGTEWTSRTPGEITDGYRNLCWQTASWVGAFAVALVREGFPTGVLTEDEPSRATVAAARRAIGAALEAAGEPDEFASKDEIR